MSFIAHYIFLFCSFLHLLLLLPLTFSVSWSVSYTIKEDLKLHVNIALNNARQCKELLTLSNLVEFGLVSEEEKMISSILAGLKKRSSTVNTLTNAFMLPKKAIIDQTASLIKNFHSLSEDKNMVDKASSKVLVGTSYSVSRLYFFLCQGVHKACTGRFCCYVSCL